MSMAGRNQAKGDELVNRIREAGGEGIFVACDLRKKEDVQRLKEEAYKAFDRVDILFNAGPASWYISLSWSRMMMIST